MLYTSRTVDSDHAIIDAVGSIAGARNVSRAQVALAWLHSKPAVTAPIVGANTTAQIGDAVASVSDDAEMQNIRDQIPGYANV